MDVRDAVPQRSAGLVVDRQRAPRPRGRAQLELLATGFFRDGALAGGGSIALWPAQAGGIVHGTLTFRVAAPASFDRAVTLRLTAPGARATAIRVSPGASRAISLPICATGAWVARFAADRVVWLDGRTISLETTAPRWQPDESPCTPTAPPG